MKKLFISLIMLFCLTTNVFADSSYAWSTKDKTLLGLDTILNVVDILQTREAFNNPNFDEGNFLLKGLGCNGATIAMLVGNIALYRLALDSHFLVILLKPLPYFLRLRLQLFYRGLLLFFLAHIVGVLIRLAVLVQ